MGSLFGTNPLGSCIAILGGLLTAVKSERSAWQSASWLWQLRIVTFANCSSTPVSMSFPPFGCDHLRKRVTGEPKLGESPLLHTKQGPIKEGSVWDNQSREGGVKSLGLTGLLKRYILQPVETWLFPAKQGEATIYKAMFR